MILLIAAFVSATLHLIADYRGARTLTYVFKPLTIVLLIAFVVVTAAGTYATIIAIGLALSLAGDVSLMLPHDHFIAGLVSFLAAHVAYVIAFSMHGGFANRPWTFAPYVVAAGVLLTILWPRLGKYRVPVVIYVTVLVGMAGQAAATGSRYAAIGGALFVCSDAILAFNRFYRRFHAAQGLIMSTYVVAQALIALSVR